MGSYSFRWTDLVEGLLFVLVLHELFVREFPQSPIIRSPIKIANSTGLLPETAVKATIVSMMLALVIVTHIGDGQRPAAAKAMSCGQQHDQPEEPSVALEQPLVQAMAMSFNPRNDAQGRTDPESVILE